VATLERIYAERGEYNLDFLATTPVPEAMAFLTSLPGVGHKTASIVLLFCFNRAAFPVDTHIQRISQRLGLASRRAMPEKIKGIWEALLPPETFYPLHLNLIRLGREICTARVARCDVCPLAAWCDYANLRGEWTVAQ
jgi:endonuclease-3